MYVKITNNQQLSTTEVYVINKVRELAKKFTEIGSMGPIHNQKVYNMTTVASVTSMCSNVVYVVWLFTFEVIEAL